jgi:hypothetical protein
MDRSPQRKQGINTSPYLTPLLALRASNVTYLSNSSSIS